MSSDQVIIFPDAEEALIGHLRTQYEARQLSVRVGTQRAPDLNVAAVRVSLAGGGEQLVTHTPMLTVSIWDTDSVEASRLARLTLGLVRTVPGLKDFNIVGGLQNYPDPDTNAPRYQFTVELKFRGKTEE